MWIFIDNYNFFFLSLFNYTSQQAFSLLDPFFEHSSSKQ